MHHTDCEYRNIRMKGFQCTADYHQHLTSGLKAIILRIHSSVKRPVKTMFRYFSIDSYTTGAP